MARQTVEQQDSLQQLIVEYGDPDVIAIEHTDAPYGLLKVEWAEQEFARRPRRQLLVRPDGERLSWRTLIFAGEPVEARPTCGW